MEITKNSEQVIQFRTIRSFPFACNTQYLVSKYSSLCFKIDVDRDI